RDDGGRRRPDRNPRDAAGVAGGVGDRAVPRGRPWGGWWTPLLMAPLLLPQYLVYSGWDLLRDPGSGIGDWLARQPGWASIWAGYVLAVGGMALWAWPIAAIPLAAGIRQLGAPALEAA